MSVAKSIAVFGGSGFLGRKICEVGVQKGYQVTAFSRSGEPPQAVIHQPWITKVNWEPVDIFDPKSYTSKLAEFGTVVHSIGLLFENPSYKRSMNSNFNFLNDIQNFANSLKGSNPMEKNETNTYEAIQRDSAVLLADNFLEHQRENPTYVYISADQQFPIVPEDYLTTKREAEFELSCKKGLRAILMRPSFMYDDSHEGGLDNRDIVAKLLKLGYGTKEFILGDRITFLNKQVRPPVSTAQVARSIYEKIENPEFKGVVTLEEIARH
ncbi:uncharacterized protein RJT20DRAFT_129270 [Scheffersomyces xylosifermentans]|uniref:uncharacterized protein n=1 Tax=Scheffersomyces xylosifermentans TaxID=1304137 RepID=UPI00315C8554